MKKLRHGVAALVIFVFFIGLFISVYNNMEDSYGFNKGDVMSDTPDVEGSGNIVEQLEKLTIMQSLERIQSATLSIKTGSAQGFDILGALGSIALGVLQSTIGLLIFPFQITNIIFSFYTTELLGNIAGLVVIVSVYTGFILLSAYLKHDV